MTTSPTLEATQQQQRNITNRSHSPKFSDTIERNLFMKNVISSPSASSQLTATTTAENRIIPRSPSQQHGKESAFRRSLEEISKEIKEIEDFITVSENIIRKEREKDRELYAREKRRKLLEKKSIESPNKENKTPTPPKLNSPGGHKSPPTFKINAYRTRKSKFSPSPRFSNSKLYFRNGRIGCVEADQNASNVESTHALIKHILKYENEKPLVSPESVQKVLKEIEIAHKKERKKERMKENKVEPLEIKETEMIQEESNEREFTEPQGNPEEPQTEVFETNEVVDKQEVSSDKKIAQEECPESCIEPQVSTEEYRQEEFMYETDEGITSIAAMANSASDNKLDKLDADGQQFVRDQVRHLVRRFTARTSKMRSRLELPPTPSSSASSPSPPPPGYHSRHPQLISMKSNTTDPSDIVQATESSSHKIKTVATSTSTHSLFQADHQSLNSGALLCAGLCGSSKNEGVLDPQGRIYISWLCVVSLTFLYNAWVIPLRSSFPFQTPENTNIWLFIDFCADLVYLLDVIFFKHRVMYLFEGFWVKDKNLTRKNYMRKLQFKLDLLSLIPLDLLYFKYGTAAVYLRFPRFLKIQSFWEVFKLLDRVISSPHFVRVAKTLTYMLYMIHLTACAYYAYSAYQGLGINRWVFSGKGHPYVRCFAFATKTATSIGKNPKPEKEGELMFMTAAWLMGVFVFALLIGQIRDIIGTATRSQSEYRQLVDETLEYMRRLNLPREIQRRVKMWFKFTWDQQRTLDESHILDSLPANLKTDIAISVHIQTLSKVQLFADCEEALLRELVLKLRSVTFLPGDYVCRKGEVGKEMYIVKLGQVQVMGGPNNDEVLATLSEGSVFGEISLLAINGEQGNRRTADVKSKGFSNLFVLSKSDLNEAIVYYPNAQAILKKRARSLIRKNAAREREEAKRSAIKADVVIGNPQTPLSPPKLLKTVIQVLPEESPAVVLLTRGSKKGKKHKNDIENNLNGNTGENGKEGKKNFQLTSKSNEERIFKFENVTRPKSPDLLSSIQDELKNKNKFINLTDSEKALIVFSSSLSQSSDGDDECDDVVMISKM